MALALTADVAGAGRPVAGLTNTWIQAQVADELVGTGEAPDVTDHTHDGQRCDQPDTGDGHQMPDASVAQRLTPSSRRESASVRCR